MRKIKTFFIQKAINAIYKNSSEPHSVKVVLANGSSFRVGDTKPEIVIEFTNTKSEWKVLFFRGIGISDGYTEGIILFNGEQGIRNFLRMAFRVDKKISKESFDLVEWIMKQWQEYRFNNRNRVTQIANLRQHYALPTEFFYYMTGSLFGYTEGYFETGDETQNEAQYKKYQHICHKLQLQPGDNLIEVGSAWGTLSLLAAKEYGAKVTNYGLIPEQNRVFEKRIKDMKLDSLIKNVKKDARDLGQEQEVYDKYVSLGVLEHAGVDMLEEWFKNISNCLKPGGLGVISFTGFQDHQLLYYTVFRNIWRGCYLPSFARVSILMEKYDLHIMEVEDARFAYAATMQQMLDNINTHWSKIKAIDSDIFTEQFRREWEYYYIGSMEGMRCAPKKQLHAYQVVFTKGADTIHSNHISGIDTQTPIDTSTMQEYEVASIHG